MYAKDKSIQLRIRISPEEQQRLKSEYNTFLSATQSNISFSEFLRRLLITNKIEC